MNDDDDRLERDDDEEGIAENPVPEGMLEQEASDQIEADVEGVRAADDLFGPDPDR